MIFQYSSADPERFISINMENMQIYNAVRVVPQEAQKKIEGGRLKGMTDINPMWRIQKLTEQFGPCGVGWKYVIRDKRLESGCKGEIAAFVDVDLYYMLDGKWSEAVPGTGGASFVTEEKGGLRMSDECFKMALTDALSVACKALGMGADVYWSAGRTKYDAPPELPPPICDRCGKEIRPYKNGDGSVKTVKELVNYSRDAFQMTLCGACIIKRANDK